MKNLWIINFLVICACLSNSASAEELNLNKIPVIGSEEKQKGELYQKEASPESSYDEALAGLNIRSKLENEAEEHEITFEGTQLRDDEKTLVLAPEKPEKPEQISVAEIVSQASEKKDNPLSYEAAQAYLSHVDSLINNGNLGSAQKRSEELIEWLNQAIDAHFTLYNVFKENNNTEKLNYEHDQALSFAKLRDQALLTVANLYIQKEEFKDAVEPLVKVIESQPGSDLATEAYKLLNQIGF